MQQWLGLVMGGAGLAALIWTTSRRNLAKRSRSWPQADGLILSSSIGASGGGSTEHGNGNRTFHADVQYEYDVAGRKHRGNRICIGGELNTSFRGRAEARCTQYPAGKHVRVHYDPANPDVACLEPVCEVAVFTYSIGAAFVLIGGLLFYFAK